MVPPPSNKSRVSGSASGAVATSRYPRVASKEQHGTRFKTSPAVRVGQSGPTHHQKPNRLSKNVVPDEALATRSKVSVPALSE